ncbi:MAG: hypothetical protein AAB955_00895 [Patescibacteria group bacterium]
MKYDSDEALADELSRVGRAISPRPESLRAALKGEPRAVPSPLLLFTITSYMSSYTKLGATLVAILVVAGGVYYLSMPGGTGEVALIQESAQVDTMAMKTAAATDIAAPPVDDSFEGFAAAMEADLAAQQAAVAAVDQDADASASSVSSDTNSQALYDPASL